MDLSTAKNCYDRGVLFSREAEQLHEAAKNQPARAKELEAEAIKNQQIADLNFLLCGKGM
jgi:hypothetical protein